jgi:hypothetical protein
MHTASRRLASLAIAALLALVLAGSAAGQQATISNIDPASGPTAGGTTVVITGTYLLSAAPPIVRIGGAEATNVSEEFIGNGPGAKVTVITPPGAAGAADVVVISRTSQVELVRVTGGFTYVAPAPPTPSITVTGVSPASGLTTGGEVVTITGTGFSGGSTPTVAFRGAGTTADGTAVTVASDTRLTVTTPPLAKGLAGISVTQGGAAAVLADAYFVMQGYWLTVTTGGPSDIGTLGSLGAVRTPFDGDWATRSSPFTSYSGGINCGDRTRVEQLTKRTVSTVSWAGGPCRYAFPELARVELEGLSSVSETVDFSGVDGRAPEHAPYRILQQGFISGWYGACGSKTVLCTVRMTRNLAVIAQWGYFMFTSGAGQAGTTTYREGRLDLSLLAAEEPDSTGGAGTYNVVVTVPVKWVGEHGASARPRQVVACRAKARLSGRRLTARCAPNQALTRALRKGSVRMTTRWYVRLPNQRAARLIAKRTQMVRSPRPGAVTG